MHSCQFAHTELGLLPLLLCVTLPLSASSARNRPALAPDSGYVLALAAADHFLQAWQAGDLENGMALLTGNAKNAANRDVVERFFSNPDPSGYEINRGKLVKHGRYEFPVVLVTVSSRNAQVRRRFFSVVVVNTGNNDWAVDRLP